MVGHKTGKKIKRTRGAIEISIEITTDNNMIKSLWFDKTIKLT